MSAFYRCSSRSKLGEWHCRYYFRILTLCCSQNIQVIKDSLDSPNRVLQMIAESVDNVKILIGGFDSSLQRLEAIAANGIKYASTHNLSAWDPDQRIEEIEHHKSILSGTIDELRAAIEDLIARDDLLSRQRERCESLLSDLWEVNAGFEAFSSLFDLIRQIMDRLSTAVTGAGDRMRKKQCRDLCESTLGIVEDLDKYLKSTKELWSMFVKKKEAIARKTLTKLRTSRTQSEPRNDIKVEDGVNRTIKCTFSADHSELDRSHTTCSSFLSRRGSTNHISPQPSLLSSEEVDENINGLQIHNPSCPLAPPPPVPVLQATGSKTPGSTIRPPIPSQVDFSRRSESPRAADEEHDRYRSSGEIREDFESRCLKENTGHQRSLPGTVRTLHSRFSKHG
jgi:hypothetical protein